MYFKLKCPHCEKSLKVREELAGRKCGCPYCKGSIRIPEEAPPTPAESTTETPKPSGGFPNLDISAGTKAATSSPAAKLRTKSKPQKSKPTSSGGKWTDSSNVSLLQSGLIAVVASTVFLVVIFPFRQLSLVQLFWDRGWVPFVVTLLTFWSLAILLLKWKKLKRQRASLLLDVLPTELSEEITVESLDKFFAHIHSLPGEPGESFLINRVLRGIEHFRVRKSAAETGTMMESQSAIDANNVASSYTIVKVFIWALPIMGFIGTVIGVSAAVASLAGSLENASDLSAIKGALNDVFAGLGTAFDTTLLALVLSLLVKIPTSAMQKNEEDLVTWVDEYCNENLLKRLNDGREGGAERGSSANTTVFRQAVEQAMAAHQAELESWSKRLESIGSSLTDQVVGGWSEINDKLRQQQTELAGHLQNQQHETAAHLLDQHHQRAEDLRKQQDERHEQLCQQQQQLADQMEKWNSVADQLQQTLQTLAEQSATLQSRVTESMDGSTQSLQTHFSGLERGLNSLGQVLEKLGEQQIVVQQVESPKRRGWFSRRKNGSR